MNVTAMFEVILKIMVIIMQCRLVMNEVLEMGFERKEHGPHINTQQFGIAVETR